jgi:hypothetical protein
LIIIRPFLVQVRDFRGVSDGWGRIGKKSEIKMKSTIRKKSKSMSKIKIKNRIS